MDTVERGLFNILPDMPAPLRTYQWEGIRFVMDRSSALVADEMGLGKTVQVAVALSLMLRTGGSSRALVVVPASLRLNWERELVRWAPNLSVRIVRGDANERQAHYRLPFHILIASYEQVRADALALADVVRFDVVVLDEAQRIKNADSDTALACRLLRRDRSWGLTGTPIENSVSDLLSVFRFIRPGLISRGMPKPEMHAAMQPYFLRRRKADVLPELPPITIQEIPLELGARQRETYDLVWADRRATLSTSASGFTVVSMLSLITKLKQICNFDPHSNESAKLEALQVIIEGLSGNDDKLIVFSQFVETLRWLAGQIRDEVPLDLFHGGLSDQTKDRIIARFNNQPGPRVLLMSLKAGGLGLNLQGASSVVLFDRWWNPAVEDQAVHRAHRFGRLGRLHVYRFIVVDSVEELVAQVLDEKRVLFEEYVEAAESAATSLFTREELTRILGLSQT